MGLPGTLPVVNRRAIECAVMIGLALNCKAAERVIFYRKNYYYPDLPKNFQISQYDKAGGAPVAHDGYLQIDKKKVRIRRVQLEEDPGKLSYEGTIERSRYSLVDYNRAGVALVEIVTEPDIESPKEAKLFLEKLKSMIESLGVSNGELEGAMRCDANISLGHGERVEIKNISSFREVAKALSYEILRQRTFSNEVSGKSETRHWDERRSITISLRTKEEEQDYRYFPEPDIPAIFLTSSDIKKIEAKMPELPELRAQRFIKEYRIPVQTAMELVKNEEVASFFESCAKMSSDPAKIANWILGDIRAQVDHFHDEGKSLALTPQSFIELLDLVDAGRITKVQARDVLKLMVKTGRSPSAIVRSKGLGILDERDVYRAVDKIIATKREVFEQAKREKKAFNYLIGQVLREEPKAEPKLIAKAIAMKLKEHG
jgi:aspartyl-tRNA(Asn)/glutamyl-tRNA(Gln) amidotransferase subunit B